MPDAPVVSGGVNLPTGVKVTAGRETSQTNAQGTVIQGMIFSIDLGGGTTSTAFVPYSEIGNTGDVEAIINDRVRSIRAIAG